ncbi:hypothetical protein EIN_481600 [Entamoeba invadens IP1]|uniref:Uncharacterized protein n=1 Tax=Entamoeba invadens IP1 TaxID=370355 RepID=L7FPS4_ENTIV|nr:hypothetical protein EIN_481600 [Entamoeba invadens IP1]ELP95350.1 hypothetical protein EIN_481600 [Entamoeba invadens IP1]|eukprot:XP_004262121.1 hypothetical protein EIN_481600 [Entamoeba invadens IP1]
MMRLIDRLFSFFSHTFNITVIVLLHILVYNMLLMVHILLDTNKCHQSKFRSEINVQANLLLMHTSLLLMDLMSMYCNHLQKNKLNCFCCCTDFKSAKYIGLKFDTFPYFGS